jgi:hypothetical protein
MAINSNILTYYLVTAAQEQLRNRDILPAPEMARNKSFKEQDVISAFKPALLKIIQTNLTKYFKINIILEFHNYVSRHGNIGHIVSVTVSCKRRVRKVTIHHV